MAEPGVNRGHGRCPWHTSSCAALLIAQRVDGSDAVACELEVGSMFAGDEVVAACRGWFPAEVADVVLFSDDLGDEATPYTA